MVEAEQNEDADGRELRPRRNIDQGRAALQSDDVDRREQHDRADRDEVPARQRPSQPGCDRRMGRGERQDRADVFRKADGERCDGATLPDGEDHPAVEERRKLAIRFAQEDILAA